MPILLEKVIEQTTVEQLPPSTSSDTHADVNWIVVVFGLFLVYYLTKPLHGLLFSLAKIGIAFGTLYWFLISFILLQG